MGCGNSSPSPLGMFRLRGILEAWLNRRQSGRDRDGWRVVKGRKKFVIGIVGGLCPAAIADIYLKLTMLTPLVRHDSDYYDIVVTSDPNQEVRGTELMAGTGFYDTTHRMLYVYQVARMLEAQGAGIIVVPDFITHTSLGVLRKGIRTPFLDLVEALATATREDCPAARRVGILTTTHCLTHDVFGPRFRQSGFEPVYPDAAIQKDCVMEALYGAEGMKRGHFSGKPLELIGQAVRHLLGKSVDAIAFGVTELPLLPRAALPPATYIDCNEAAARMLIRQVSSCAAPAPEEKRIGILGGLGPSATVDLFDKIVRCTPAKRDQDHLKIVIENDPSVPDRTQALLHGGDEPSVSLLASARRLEAAGVQLIVCPCNTAHAFLGKVQEHLSTPILFMPDAVGEHIAARYPAAKKVGLLATDGTIRSRVYAEVMERRGLTLLVPDEAQQKRVMEAIYGDRGIKAGVFGGEPRELLRGAAQHLIHRGAELVIMGCTEIPLVLEKSDAGVPLVDATEVLAETTVRELTRLADSAGGGQTPRP